jgi:hypothetical protein
MAKEKDKTPDPSQIPGIRQTVVVPMQGIQNTRPNAIELNPDGETGNVVKKVEPLPVSNGEETVAE